MRKLWVPAVLCLALSAPVQAGNEADQPTEEELRRARAELERARDDLRRAAEDLARVTRQMDHDSPRAKAWEYMANPRRAMMGVTIDDGPEKGGERRGVLITGVTPGSGADKAGLKSGDLLVSANGQKLATKADVEKGPQYRLKEIIGELKDGDKVKLEYERDGGKRVATTVTATRPEMKSWGPLAWNDEGDFDVVIPPIPPIPPLPPGAFTMRMHDGDVDRGMQLAKLDTDLASYFRTDKGVLVVCAPRAGSLGLKGGDVIQKIDGKTVASPVEVFERFEEVEKDQKVKVDVVRQGRDVDLEGTLPERRKVIRKVIEVGEDEDN